ncbi:MAG: cupin domain-containing protein [Vicinamibacteria bacterium]
MGERPDPYRSLAGAYALGALDGEDRAIFEAHLHFGCPGCSGAVAAAASVLEEIPRPLPVPPRDLSLRQQLLDIAGAPIGPVDKGAYDWRDLAPGIRFHVFKEDAARGMQACLVWAAPGARNERHRHGGDEVILVLQGGLRDEHATYGPGEICRSRKGSTHTEEALPGEDCFCYVVYYGPLEFQGAGE